MLKTLCYIVVTELCMVDILAATRGEHFKNLKGKNLSVGRFLAIYQRSGRPMTAAFCASQCKSLCGSAAYSTTYNTCITFTNRFYDADFQPIQHTNWNLLYKIGPVFHNGWRLVFRVQVGINMPLYDLWLSSGVHHDDVTSQDFPVSCLRLENYGSCERHFRSSVLDEWDNIDQVQFAMYKTDQRVAYIRFDGTDTKFDSWFSQSRALDSSWFALSTDLTIAHFSIFGTQTSEAQRRFDISGIYAGCPGDTVYTTIIDTSNDNCSPIWSLSLPSYPLLLYSTRNRLGNMMLREYDTADVLAVLVKFKTQ